MQSHQKVESLYNAYLAAHQNTLTEEQFNSLLIFFPALLVVASDGVVDDEEWMYVKYLAKFMSDSFKYQGDVTESERKELEALFLENLKYLLESLDTWEEKFIDTLRDYLEDTPELKEDVLEILHLFAEASEGTSDEEQEVIDKLVQRLGLEA